MRQVVSPSAASPAPSRPSGRCRRTVTSPLLTSLVPALVLLVSACGSDDTSGADVHPDGVAQAGFGRPCTSDEQCEANACVPHIGNTVCSQHCDPDAPCPDNWTCWTPPATSTADGQSICVSPYWSLCRPCSADADCSSLADDDPGNCIDYNGSGTFCGTDCAADGDCPDGFACNEVATRTGRLVRQCVATAGMCECNPYIAGLGESARCATENDWGRCLGERLCDSKLWSRCDARTPGPDAPNLIDDDCDGLTDELVCLCGDKVCDGACGETLANCPCDCAAEGDGVCSPCGESPSTSPVDCCRGPGGTAGCGDGFCIGFGCGENPATCPQDCSTPCGNELCEPGENPFSCAEDCKHEVCGNNICESSDGGPEACPQDCDAYCGDCECEAVRDESVFNCAIDCGYCGDGSCSTCALLNENPTTCAVDCCQPSPEACNGVDDDCDGETDEADAIGCRLFYRDDDGDSLGRWDDARCQCAAAGAWGASVLGDCDDADLAVGLGFEEACNEVDDDCDGVTDEDFDLGTSCAPPGGVCVSGMVACDGPDRTACGNGPAVRKGTLCGALTCRDGIIQPPSLCDGAGACVPLPLVQCDGYMCDDSGRCDDHCDSDAECRDGYACGADGDCERVDTPCEADAACVDQDWATTDFCVIVCGHGEREDALPDGDVDGDGVPNDVDVCPETPDPLQRDRDSDGRGDLCDACEGAGAAETCNGQDDDCDGQTDDGFGVGASCVADTATCRVGVRVCNAAGTTSCPATGDAPAGLACGAAACVGDDLRLASRCDGAGACTPGFIVPCQGFACEPGAPPTTGPGCATDCAMTPGGSDCAAGYHCATTPGGGACAPDLANGEACGSDIQCASGMCIDGHCCATDCTAGCFTCGSANAAGQCVPVAPNTDPKSACGPCAACNAVGVCTNVAAGPSPKNACPVELPCGTTGLCDNQGACRVAAAGTACNTATCFNGSVTAGTTCDGLGDCRDATTSACAGDLLCADASACLTRCTTDRDCRVGNFCDATGVCLDLKARGQPCTADRMCTSGICADSLCCDGRCTGLCESCATAAAPGTCSAHTTGTDPEEDCGECGTCNSGACLPHARGTDPDDDCAARAPCFQTGFCDGDFGCAAAASTATCGDGACIGTVLVAPRLCDGEGSCNDPVITPCVAYRCDNGGAACRTGCSNGAHCQDGFFCAGGQCVPKHTKGATCASASSCLSAFCSDNRCCDTSCGNVCETCAGNNPGTCSDIDGAPDGACSGELICESGECRLTDGASCSADGECANRDCVDGVCCPTSCNGECETCESGECQPISSELYPGECPINQWCGLGQNCEPVAGSDCTPTPGCPNGFVCTGGICDLPAPLGTTCGADPECASGQCTDGVCCESECLGICRKCKPTGRCENLPAGTEEAGDCPDASETCGPDGGCKKATGETCNSNTDCANARCVDNRCCPELCNGECESCATGVCLGVTSPATDLATCPAPGLCAGRGNCVNATNGVCAVDGDCSSNECITLAPGIGFCCASACTGDCRSCVRNGNGTCSDVVAAENPGICEGTRWCDGAKSCVTKVGMSCAAGETCAPGTWCETGTCQPLVGLGGLCVNGGSCAGGLPCVDGRCCENGCADECESCNQASALGRCEPLANFATDPMCLAGEVCSRAAGGCAFATGKGCAADDECASGYCVDSLCCNRACDGTCESCAAAGICALVTNAEAPRCGDDFACNNAGACSLAAGRPCLDATDCASGSCGPGDVCCAVGCDGQCERCEVDGSCTEALNHEENLGRCDDFQWCDDGLCVGKNNLCGRDTDCATDYFCGAGTCTPDKSLGEDCLAAAAGDDPNDQCASGFCASGICCESECDGICQICWFDEFPGQCIPAPTGDDPGNLCGVGMACNGPERNGDCGRDDTAVCANDFECASGQCDNGKCCHKACDGVCERCTADGQNCEPVPSGDDNATCPSPRACLNGVCKDGLGEPCTADGECASGFCANVTVASGSVGVCCNNACSDPCRNCDPLDGRCKMLVLQDEPGCTPASNWCDKNGDCRLETGSGCGNDSQCPLGFFCSSLLLCEQRHVGGQSCTRVDGSDCETGFCANNVCCQAPCEGPCETCDPGGVCRLDPVFSTGGCGGGLQCNIIGNCTKVKGSPCLADSECASGFCGDVPASGGVRVCTDTRCDGLCEAPGLDGTCNPVVSGVDEACNAPFECAGRNQCKLQLAQLCGSDNACASGICEDDMCCSATCALGNHCSGGNCVPNECTSNTQCGLETCENGQCCKVECGRCQRCGGLNMDTCVPVFNRDTTDCNGTVGCNGSAMCTPDAVNTTRL